MNSDQKKFLIKEIQRVASEKEQAVKYEHDNKAWDDKEKRAMYLALKLARVKPFDLIIDKLPISHYCSDDYLGADIKEVTDINLEKLAEVRRNRKKASEEAAEKRHKIVQRIHERSRQLSIEIMLGTDAEAKSLLEAFIKEVFE